VSGWLGGWFLPMSVSMSVSVTVVRLRVSLCDSIHINVYIRTYTYIAPAAAIRAMAACGQGAENVDESSVAPQR